MKQTFAIAALAGVAMAQVKNLIGDAKFIQFQSVNSKSYKSTTEYYSRLNIYQNNDRIINVNNAQ